MKKIPLKHIALELTSQCNLACIYCYNIWKRPGAELASFNSYTHAIRSLKKLFNEADIQNVTLTGGETFLAERILEIALFCRMEGKTVTIISNGYVGKRKQYKQLIQMGIHLFEMPIHSANPSIHDGITQVKGSWQKSIDSLLTIKEYGGYPVAVVVITKENVEQIGDTLGYIYCLGIKRVMMNRYNIGGNGTAHPASVSATHSQLINAYKIANDKAKELGLTLSSNVCTPICLIDPKKFPHIMFGHCSPDVLKKPITLDINGNIRVCNHSPVVAGNIFKQSLQEILYSPYTESWKDIIPDHCSECKIWEKCFGGCRAASEQCGLGLHHVDPILTEQELQN